ncbi:D-2-hydroxyacid dehydrogenase [Salinispirillum sp. LH 10-3-1]|uniref:D-2-hydroxyacid dehydrogenase n=1 Tax=Salinispirillum sp. LH 10-3-1 TaxID=2952525 RepID=A0AB38YCE9_9GAMM
MKQRLKVALVSQRTAQWRMLLAQHKDLPIQLIFDDEENFAERARHCSVLWGDTPEGARWLPRLPNIQWYHTFFSGVDALLPLRAQLPKDLLVTNSRDIAGPHIAEYVLGQLLNLSRQIGHYQRLQQQCQWQWMDYRTVEEDRALVLGTGAIGQTVAQRLAPWVERVDGVSRSGRAVEGFGSVHQWHSIHPILDQYRIVVNTLPHTPETDGVLAASFFDALAADAIFINVGRGATVQDEALLSALDAEPERRAVLDVFRVEPLPQEHPYWQHKQVVVTPHVAAQSQPQWVLPIVLDNLRRYLDGASLRNLVDLELGY